VRPLAFARGTGGQSLIETALMLPLMLFVLVGVADVGRIYYYATSVASAAREAAVFAARDVNESPERITQRACDEFGAASCPSYIHVSVWRSGTCLTEPVECLALTPVKCQPERGNAQVTVTHDLSLIAAGLIGRFFRADPVPVRGTACVPELAR